MERLGSIVTEILKNGILVSIDTLKEFTFSSYSKHIRYIKFGVTHQKLLISKNSTVEVSSSHFQKVEYCISCQRKNHVCVIICFILSLFFYRGDRVEPSGPRISRGGLYELELKVPVFF